MTQVGVYSALIEKRNMHEFGGRAGRWFMSVREEVRNALIGASGVFNTPAGELKEFYDPTADVVRFQVVFNSDAWTGKTYVRENAIRLACAEEAIRAQARLRSYPS